MIPNFTKVFFRKLKSNTLNYAINLTGLVVGLICTLLIGTYIYHELSYDKYHNGSDRIYRVLDIIHIEDYIENSTSCPFPAGPLIAYTYPDKVASMVRLYNKWGEAYTISLEDLTSFKEKRFVFADSTLFDVFNMEFIEGDANNALVEPYTIVLTESMAKKYFNQEQAVGQRLRFNDKYHLTVKAVIKDLPIHTHFHFDAFVSFATLVALNNGQQFDAWSWNPCWTYIKLKEGISQSEFQNDLVELKANHFADHQRDLRLQPLHDIHLYSHLDFEIEFNSNVLYIYVLSGIILVILLIVIINYINQSIAQGATRAKEIGVKKVMGAQGYHLYIQFMSESIILSFIALLLAIIFIYPAVPLFNFVTGKSFSYNHFFTPYHYWFYMLAPVVLGLLAGTYPAFHLASLNAIQAIKSKLTGTGSLRRKVLITVQYVVSIGMIIFTFCIFTQIDFLKNTDPGFSKAQTLVLEISNTQIVPRKEEFIEELKQHSQIENAALMEFLFGYNYNTNSFFPEASTGEGVYKLLPFNTVSHEFFETFNIEILEGRGFNKLNVSDCDEAVMINESMAKSQGWTIQQAIGKKFGYRDDGKHRVVGVFKDYHFSSLHSPIQPLVLKLPKPDHSLDSYFVGVRVSPGNFAQTITFLEEKWKSFESKTPFEYFFLDAHLDALYKSEEQLGKVSTLFTLTAVILSCVGIVGLIIFMAKQKLKEVAIRKVLGASNAQIIWLFSLEFLILIVISSVVAWPLAYYGMERWLSSFAYKAELSLGSFFVASLIVVVITEIIVFYYILKTTKINPAEVLRNG
jgi:putative ABC transport system permease protein